LGRSARLDASDGHSQELIPLQKTWSPASRDPRFSRCTPDALRAVIESKNHSGATIGNASLWAAAIVASKARKTAKNLPARARLMSRLMKMADVVEKERVDAERKGELDSPRPAVPSAGPETAACEPPQRSVFAREACGPFAGSPVPALGPLA
jgi:hypothetical protein